MKFYFSKNIKPAYPHNGPLPILFAFFRWRHEGIQFVLDAMSCAILQSAFHIAAQVSGHGHLVFTINNVVFEINILSH